MSLSDLELLLIQCKNSEARRYVGEAISCYNSGAYRAAIIMIWVAIVYDLIEKINELSLSGDKAAEQLKGVFENYQRQIHEGNKQGLKNALDFERTILSSTKNLQLLDDYQITDLERIRDDRNRSSHPSLHFEGTPFLPSAEQARTHIVNAVTHLISCPTVQGKFAFERIKRLVLRDEFPHSSDSEKRVFDILNECPLCNASPPLVKEVTSFLFFGFLSEGHVLFKKYKATHCLKYIFSKYPDIFNECMEKNIKNTFLDKLETSSIPFAIAILNIFPHLSSLLTDGIKARFITHIEVCNGAGLVPTIRYGLNSEVFKEYAEKRVLTLDFDMLCLVSLYASDSRAYIKAAIREFGRAKTWHQANNIYDKLLSFRISGLLKDDILKVISTGGDLSGSSGFYKFLVEVLYEKKFTREELIVHLEKYGKLNDLPSEEDVLNHVPF